MKIDTSHVTFKTNSLGQNLSKDSFCPYCLQFQHRRSRKKFPYFHQVRETRVEVWEKRQIIW